MPQGPENKASPLARAARRLNADGAPALIGMTDPVRLPDPERALAALPPGNILIWRAYGQRLGRDEIRHVARLAENRNCLLLLAGQPRLAIHAHGMHLPEYALIDPLTDGYLMDPQERGPGFIVTAAAHSRSAIRRAAQRGVDAVLLSPVFPTQSHPGAAHLGTVRLASLARHAAALGLASYALGGVSSPADIRRLKGTGVTGIAGIGFLLDK
ncbi:thiamine-phosphate pyrophosphorylase [Parvibaculum indicum]|uniref:thiamine phosphate synthase n=1 Tax=Parvibaculum indicum TaxID=562969 RepID=UPI001420088F|nr:thiamine-phosphate pyrophosphorylase [Parvibaculum indicum]